MRIILLIIMGGLNDGMVCCTEGEKDRESRLGNYGRFWGNH